MATFETGTLNYHHPRLHHHQQIFQPYFLQFYKILLFLFHEQFFNMLGQHMYHFRKHCFSFFCPCVSIILLSYLFLSFQFTFCHILHKIRFESFTFDRKPLHFVLISCCYFQKLSEKNINTSWWSCLTISLPLS